MTTNLSTAKDILIELQEAVQSAKESPDNFQLAILRLRGCKHAIQLKALEFAERRLALIEKGKIPNGAIEDASYRENTEATQGPNYTLRD